MAKPIRATPVLRGEDAKQFLRKMIAEQEHPNPNRIKFIENAMAKKELFERWIREANGSQY